MTLQYPTIADCVGNTPLVRLQRMAGETSNTLLLKLEGNNPAGSVKDRPALSMITRAELRGQIKPGDTLIEATSGNTGIALAMAAAIKGYKMILIMPDNSSAERKAAMTAYGAELILVTQEEGMEGARDLAERMAAEGRGKVLDQFANGDNPRRTTPPPARKSGARPRAPSPISSAPWAPPAPSWAFALPQRAESRVQIIGLQPMEGSAIPGIRRWPESTCRRSTTRRAWTASSTWPSAKPRTPPVAWPAKKASSAACPRAVPWRHAALVQRSGKRGDRRDHLRPWRPLPVDRHFRRAQLMAKHERPALPAHRRQQGPADSRGQEAAPDHRAPGQ
jgi:cysteine synthase B